MPHSYLFRHCPVCGHELKTSVIRKNEPSRLVCTDESCRFVFYLDPKLVACAIVEREGKIILLKRAFSPEQGKWVMPGGYVDRGEVVEDAAVREAREECGVDIELKEILGIYSYDGYLAVVIVYLAEYVSGELSADNENTDIRFMDLEEIPWDNLAFESTRDALKDYYELKKKE
jgi:ADP-ribose pyrophosphatase YjhB (NUDIX family)